VFGYYNRDELIKLIHECDLYVHASDAEIDIIANEEFEVIDEVSKIHLISSAIDEWKRYNEREFQLYLDMENLSVSKMGTCTKLA